MSKPRRGLRLRSLLLLFLLGATPLSGVRHAPPTSGAGGEAALAPAGAAEPADPSGSGVWERAGCILCASALLAGGGTSILGVAVIAITFPELAAACGLTCAYAFG